MTELPAPTVEVVEEARPRRFHFRFLPDFLITFRSHTLPPHWLLFNYPMNVLSSTAQQISSQDEAAALKRGINIPSNLSSGQFWVEDHRNESRLAEEAEVDRQLLRLVRPLAIVSPESTQDDEEQEEEEEEEEEGD